MLQSLLLGGTKTFHQAWSSKFLGLAKCPHDILNTLLIIRIDSHKSCTLTLFRTESCEIKHPVQDRGDENHTLSCGTSPYRPYGSNPPPRGGWGSKGEETRKLETNVALTTNQNAKTEWSPMRIKPQESLPTRDLDKSTFWWRIILLPTISKISLL